MELRKILVDEILGSAFAVILVWGECREVHGGLSPELKSLDQISEFPELASLILSNGTWH